MDNNSSEVAKNNTDLTVLNTGNKLFYKYIRIGFAQKTALVVGCILHLAAYLPIVCNLLYMFKNEVDDIKLFFELPLVRWLIENFDQLRTDYKSLAIGSAILLWAVPFLSHLTIRIIFAVVNKFRGAKSIEALSAEAAKQVCLLGPKSYQRRWSSLGYGRIPAIFGALIGATLFALTLIYTKRYNEVAIIIGGIVFIGMTAGASALLYLPLSWLLKMFKMPYKTYKKLSDKTKEIDKIWVELDPDEAKRREEEAAERERRAAAERIREGTKIVINYDDSIDRYGNLSITVYIDGVSHKIHPGRNAFTVSPGSHTLDCTIYNDGSETASALDTLYCNVSLGEEYEIDIPS